MPQERDVSSLLALHCLAGRPHPAGLASSQRDCKLPVGRATAGPKPEAPQSWLVLPPGPGSPLNPTSQAPTPAEAPQKGCSLVDKPPIPTPRCMSGSDRPQGLSRTLALLCWLPPSPPPPAPRPHSGLS